MPQRPWLTCSGVGVLLVLLALGGCSRPLSQREKGALLGGGAGAGAGALMGGGTGAAIGGAAGALGGAVIGDQMERREREREYDPYYEERRRQDYEDQLRRERYGDEY